MIRLKMSNAASGKTKIGKCDRNSKFSRQVFVTE
jgi:hypothetical protein